MKYIRVKDKIYKVVDSVYLKDENFVKVDNPLMFNNIILRENIDMEGDTIEELCDEFVYISNLRTWLSPLKTLDGVYLFNKNETLIDVYGAVWTERGLKYVAKLNKKGELELL